MQVQRCCGLYQSCGRQGVGGPLPAKMPIAGHTAATVTTRTTRTAILWELPKLQQKLGGRALAASVVLPKTKQAREVQEAAKLMPPLGQPDSSPRRTRNAQMNKLLKTIGLSKARGAGHVGALTAPSIRMSKARGAAHEWEAAHSSIDSLAEAPMRAHILSPMSLSSWERSAKALPRALR